MKSHPIPWSDFTQFKTVEKKLFKLFFYRFKLCKTHIPYDVMTTVYFF